MALDAHQVIAYYTLVVGNLEWQNCPDDLRKGLGKYPVPVLVIARLAVDLRFQGKGLGIGMIKDAFLRAIQVSHIAGVAAVVLDAKDDDAKAYYLRKNLGLSAMPGDQMRLYASLRFICQVWQEVDVCMGKDLWSRLLSCFCSSFSVKRKIKNCASRATLTYLASDLK